MPKVGQLVRSTEGGWVTLAPTYCPNGHPLEGNRVLVGHMACLAHRGHITWTCCACEGVVYAPALDGCVLFGRVD
ncbi:MAG: hypothetical protein K0U84_10835 [Actinomycetia bacterium]|nr:hypothetical protein [Actinomycetes bacterium]